jgi:hypothetical protein
MQILPKLGAHRRGRKKVFQAIRDRVVEKKGMNA